MKIIIEDYVSFEIAKLLKEKGFNVPCFAYYSEYIDNWRTLKMWKKYPKTYDTVRNNGYVLVPTLQIAMKWLREVHKIYIYTNIRIILEQWAGYDIDIYKTNTNDCLLGKVVSLKGLKDNTSYEQACESAIKYCLENLI